MEVHHHLVYLHSTLFILLHIVVTFCFTCKIIYILLYLYYYRTQLLNTFAPLLAFTFYFIYITTKFLPYNISYTFIYILLYLYYYFKPYHNKKDQTYLHSTLFILLQVTFSYCIYSILIISFCRSWILFFILFVFSLVNLIFVYF